MFIISTSKVTMINYDLIFYIFISSVIIQLSYLLFFYSRLALHKNKLPRKSFGVSVIICSRNEENNLKKFIPKLLNQNHENFEIIVVIDRTWDNSIEFLNELKKTNNNIKIVNLKDNGTDHFGKKLALTLGIKAAKYEHLIFTDADCYPSSEYWISEMTSGFTDDKQIVLGASTYASKKGFLNKLVRFDTAQIAINYLGYAKSSIPYMGVGRNLAYNKKVYENVSGFKSHYHIESGDDDLFINQVSTPSNTSIIFSSKSITVSVPKNNWKAWLRQKRRHHTTNYMYKMHHKVLLGLSYLSLLSYYFTIFSLAFNEKYQLTVLSFFMIRTALLIMLYYRPFKILLCKDLLWAIPIYEIILLFCYPMFQITLNSFKK